MTVSNAIPKWCVDSAFQTPVANGGFPRVNTTDWALSGAIDLDEFMAERQILTSFVR